MGRWAAAGIAAAVVATAMVVAAASRSDGGELPEQWRIWLEEEVYPLITREQEKAFRELETEAQRRAFADRLWILWGRQSGYGAAFRGMYESRLEMSRLEFDSTQEDRARVLLIHGPPSIRHLARCPEVFHPLELWAWPYIEGLGEGVVVCFFQRGSVGPFQMWTSMDGRQALFNPVGAGLGVSAAQAARPDNILSRPEYRCPDGDVLVRLIAAAESWSRDPSFYRAMYKMRDSEGGGPESSARRFMDFSALVGAKAQPLSFSVESAAIGARGGLVEVGFTVTLSGADLGSTRVGDVDVAQVDVVGEITRSDQMVDRFRYLFSVPRAERAMSMLVERMVRPGDYELRLKVGDVHSDRESVLDVSFAADPAAVVEREFPPTDAVALSGSVVASLGAASADPLVSDGRPLRLVGPAGDAVAGVHRFEAVATPAIARVTFLVDGEPILTKNRPPFDVDLDLGPFPRLTTVSAVGHDPSGFEVERDVLTVNVGRERFFLRLQPLSPSEVAAGVATVRAEVNVPSDAALDKLEVYWNDQLVETFREPPFAASVRLEGGGGFGLLRAVALLSDGSLAEDILFVNAPQFGTEVEVTSVELPVTVLDSAGKPVENLTAEDFTVFEDGELQQITHFSLNRELPVRLGIVIDTSGSMQETLPTVQRVVMGFLRDLLRPSDRAFIVAFSDRPDLLASFTADFYTLENALLALYPDRSTALYDAMITGLFQFSGVRGRKAMVVLTDGDDTSSKQTFDAAVDFAQRSGVTVYTVGVDLPATKMMTRWQLGRVAQVTGGRSFFVTDGSGLDRIYSTIDQELRTQYVLAYTSSSTRPASELRSVDVRVSRSRVKVRTLAGYYPGVR